MWTAIIKTRLDLGGLYTKLKNGLYDAEFNEFQ